MSSKDKNPQIYISKLPTYIRQRDLEDKFRKYGEIRKIQLKETYAFIEYYNYKDAEYAIERMDGRHFEGRRIVVQPSVGKRRVRRDSYRDRRERSRSYSRPREREERRKGPQKEDICYNCDGKGHWANECNRPKRIRYKLLCYF